MWEVALTFRRSNISKIRGSPSLNPYSYHLTAGRSGYFGSIDGMGDSAPLDGCAPASICMEIEITIRAPSGQKEPLDSAGGRETGDFLPPVVPGSKGLRAVPTPRSETALSLSKLSRFNESPPRSQHRVPLT